MLDLFNSFNVKVNIYKADNKYHINQKLTISSKEFPAIALMENKLTSEYHYIVIYKIKKGYITYSDSQEISVKKIKSNKFMNRIKYYIKVDLSNFKNVETEYLIKEKHNFILESIMEQKKMLITITCFSLLISVIGIFLASKLGVYINAINISNEVFLSNIIFFIGLIVSFLIVLKNAFSFIKNRICVNLVKTIEYKINKSIIKILVNTSYLNIDEYKSGEIMARINDCISLSSIISVFLIDLFPNIIINVIGIIFLFYLNYRLSIFLIISCSISLIINFKALTKIHDKNYISISDYSSYYGTLLELINSLNEVKTTNSKEFYDKRVSKLLEKYRESTIDKENHSNYISISQNMVSMILGSLLLVFGIFEVVYRDMLLGNLTIFITLSEIIQSISLNFIIFQFNLENFLIVYNRILQIFFNTKNKKGIYIKDVKCNLNKIFLKDFTVAYKDKMILSNINTILEGKNILIVGKSGCGKSTFAKCLSGLLSSYYGTIMVNDLDLKYSRSISKYHVIYLSNESTLFVGTIRDNICLGKKILEKTLCDICEQFMLTELIDSLPEKLDIKITPNQSNISTGQKQRIALIRSIIAEPDILILDEALANIDENTRYSIIVNLDKFNFMKIYISHDHLNIRECRKYLIEKGKLTYFEEKLK